MCGIVGIISHDFVSNRLIKGLKKLEYRGYDSSGIGIIEKDGKMTINRAEGKIKNLENLLNSNPIDGLLGIGHTRWATHGVPHEKNAHPHSNGSICVVHNGIIENHHFLKNQLQEKGYVFQSETDTEVMVHLLADELKKTSDPIKALASSLDKIKGTYAFAILMAAHPDKIFIARHKSPLVVGYGENEMFLGSDAIALSDLTQRLLYLEDGDYGFITQSQVHLFQNHTSVTRPQVISKLGAIDTSKGDFEHHMLKEIFEQPSAIERTYNDLKTQNLDYINWSDIESLTIVACGTSYYAGLVAKYLFEKYAQIDVNVDIASEFRYRSPVFKKNGMTIVISQSGETIDTLAALELARDAGQKTCGIINVPESSMARMVDGAILTKAGPEIGVASTKSFTCQLTVLCYLVLQAAQKRDLIKNENADFLELSLKNCGRKMHEFLEFSEVFLNFAKKLSGFKNALFLGRGTNYPLALEGALKLKELSYIHAQGYPAGELKHGPIALIDSQMPVIVLAPYDRWFSKTLSNMQEVMSRGGQIFCLTDELGQEHLRDFKRENLEICVLPQVDTFVAPLLWSIPMQMIAYYTAVLKGNDVDQPRNLAKSVTVE